MNPDGRARPAGHAARCQAPRHGLARRPPARHDREAAAPGGWRREHRPDDLQLPALGHAVVWRARLADLPLDGDLANLPAGHVVRPCPEHLADYLPIRPVLIHGAPSHGRAGAAASRAVPATQATRTLKESW